MFRAKIIPSRKPRFRIRRPGDAICASRYRAGRTRRICRMPGWRNSRETDATRDEIANVTPVAHEDPKAQTTELTVDLGFPGQPFDHIDLTVDPGAFLRSVEIATANDPQRWYVVSGGVISRTEDGEQLELDLPERTERYLKITVFNADSAPLHYVTRLALSGIRARGEVFKRSAGERISYISATRTRAGRPMILRASCRK